MHADAVFLLPGFLGFERLDDFSYFDSRVVTALQAGLKARTGRHIPVVALDTRPSSALPARQIALLQGLRHWEMLNGRLQRIHLLGHSTGGVDASLLLNRRTLSGTRWTELDSTGVRARLGAVIAMSAPQWGTCLTLAPMVRFLRTPARTPMGAWSLTRLLTRAAGTFYRDRIARDAVGATLHDLSTSLRYLMAVFGDLELLDWLQPDEMTRLRRIGQRDPTLACRFRSVLTAAGNSGGPDMPAPPDPLFRQLYDATAAGCAAVSEPRERFLAVLNLMQRVVAAGQSGLSPSADPSSRLAGQAEQTIPLIASPSICGLPVTAGRNDGIVNTCRQVLDPFDPEDEVMALVIGDHLDVLGHYPHFEIPGELDAGLLHSGSGFRDPEFHQLYDLISTRIAEEIRAP